MGLPMNFWRQIVAAVWLATVLSSLSVAVSADEPTDAAAKPAGLQTAKVTRGDLLVTVSATGTLEPEETADVHAMLSGAIKLLGPDPRGKTDPQYAGKSIDYGSPVEAGTLLAQIEDAPYRVQLDQMRASCKHSDAVLAKSKAKAKVAEAEAARAQEQFQKKAISAAELEVKKQGYKVAQALITVAEADVAQSNAYLKQVESNLESTTVRSPFRGIVIDRRVNAGQSVDASANEPALFLIGKDLKKMQVWVSVNEKDIGKIRTGQQARFKVDAFPDDRFEGKVEQVRLNAIMAQNVVSYTVIVAVDNPEYKLLPYLIADVKFEIDSRKGVLCVPNAALRWQPQPEWIVPAARDEKPPQTGRNARRVWVRDGKFVRPIDVNIGASDGTLTEITGSDLQEGTEVIVGASQNGRAAKTATARS